MEDIDSPRIKSGAMDAALEDLQWLGLDWDGEPVVQTTRRAMYEAALARLKASEQVYPCTCSRTDIAQAASAPHAEHEGPVYPGICAGRNAHDIPAAPHAWRFRVQDSPRFTDRFCGEVAIDLATVGGDFVVWKNTDTPAYQLAVVVDDAAMGISHVLRGDDLLPSTPRQILLQKALNLPTPVYAHLPLVVGEDGRRLAKRHGDTRLCALRAAGVQPEALMGLLAWSCGWIERIEPIPLKDLLPRFDLQCIPRKPFVLTAEHLRSIGYTG